MTNKPSLSKKVTNNMTARFYHHSASLAEPEAQLRPGAKGAEVLLGDAWIEMLSAADALPLIRALAAAVRLLDPAQADDLLFGAIADPEVLARMPELDQAALARMWGNIRRSVAESEHVRYCDSCDVSSAESYLLAVTIADTGERKFYYADREACGKRRAALHVAPPQADGQPANAGARP